MDRIVISVTSLSKENWVNIYQFIRSILIDGTLESKTNAFNKIIEIAAISLEKNIVKAIDVYKLDDTIIKESDLESLTKDTAFSLIYKKTDDTEDFAELVPFILLQEEFKKRISLGIDIDKLDFSKQSNYIFKCSYFFVFYNDVSPKHGFSSLYFIYEKDANNKYFAQDFVTRLRGKGKGPIKYSLVPSRNFLPLIYITEDSYKSLFGTKKDDSKEQQVILESYSKMKKDFAKSKYYKEFDFLYEAFDNQDDTFFGKWLECVFFYSLLNGGLKSIRINETRSSIQIIKTNISELVQNIIFHAGKRGLLYCIFDKKINISEKYHQYLSGFKKYKDSYRFLRAGIFDFNDKGIIDTFTASEEIEDNCNLTLANFYDTQIFITKKLSRLDLRYAAHLGIKTFVKTISEQKGYFCVETNVSYCNNGNKKSIQTVLEGEEIQLGTETEILFVNGTHYEVVFPVNPSEAINQLMFPVQRTSLLAENFPNNINNLDLPLYCVKFPGDLIKAISDCQSKIDQINGIKKAGNIILKGEEDKNEIVLDFGNESYDYKNYNIIFKLLAYLQLKVRNGFERIILINVKDDFMERFCNLIMSFTENKHINIWSKNKAIILITQNLHAQIIWGEKKNEFDYINSELSKYYCYNFFNSKKENNNSIINIKLEDRLIEKAKSFIVPYDVLINTEQNRTPFELFINRLIHSKIISDTPGELGFLVNHENTYIGNKIIVRNYYEADMMFQNTFFTERFAYLIANNIERKIRELNGNTPKVKKKIVLIGYKHYSELILKSIKRLLKKEEQVFLVIANIDKDSNDYSKNFIFDMEVNSGDIKSDILTSPESFYFASIVPIGSTLSTNDKIIAFFNYWFEQERKKTREIDIHRFIGMETEQGISTSCSISNICEEKKVNPCTFIYNHCVIVVRDVISATASKLEKDHNWKEKGINLSERIISTNYLNAAEVHYTVQLANIVKRDGEKYDNWLKRLNQDISFPQDWWREKYVNYTENSSINSQNLMGFPEVDVIKEEIHKKELARLYELKDDILKGHLDVLNCHHKFYVDTEAFVRRNNIEFNSWLEEIKKEGEDIFNQNRLNILITPSAERESDLIYAVNNYIFDGNALIVYLDIKNWRNNIVHKLSFLKKFPPNSIRFHYVDQALLTGETYTRTKSYLFSILLGSDEVANFSSIIVIVNRLTYSKNTEIKFDVNQRLYTYLNLHYPSSKMEGQDCELCKLIKYYENSLIPKTVLDSCNNIIHKNLFKLQKVHKEEIEKNNGKLSKRNFLRLVMTHELFYIISKIAQRKQNYEKTCESITDELNNIYSFFCNNCSMALSKTPESIVEINSWFKIFNTDVKSHYINMLVTDNRISFLKVISSPPLSLYIVIRKYAHEKLLDELYKILNSKQEHTYDDLKIIKSILKSLSFLKSNALVRKNVIIGIWKVLGNVVSNLQHEKNKIDRLIVSIKKKRKSINKYINSPEIIFDYSIDELQAKIKLTDVLLEELEHDKEVLNKQNIIQDFSKDVQFFIKNAIVDDEAKATFLGELIRQGKEISDFNNVQISNTILSLKNQESTNDLFKSFNGNHFIEREYINFLVWLFYDNTTIIRKTLENFSREIIKDEKLYYNFYTKINNELILRDNDVINNNFIDIKKLFEEKVKDEYYYSSFKPYLNNQDNINYVEKLIYVSYAKLKLEDINNKKNKKGIETDTKELMEVFAKIMGADEAFWTMRKDYSTNKDQKLFDCYVLSKFGADNLIEQGILSDDYYTKKLYTLSMLPKKPIMHPLVIKYNLSDNLGEKTHLKMFGLGILPILIPSDSFNKDIKENKGRRKKEIVASITFLYNSNNSLINDENNFRILVQEYGRLLLLLKNNIDKYVLDSLIKEKSFELWVRNYSSVYRFQKIYANNAHVFNSVYKEMDEFEDINETEIFKLSKTWLFLCNETISYLYSDIEKNTNGSKHVLDLNEDYIVNINNTLGNTFNDTFISILKALLKNCWNDYNMKADNNTTLMNQIFINGCDLNEFIISKDIENEKVFCNKHILQTFVTLCLHNSLSPRSKHGHRGVHEIKKINISINKESIIIEDSCLKEFYSKKGKINRYEQFKKKKLLIVGMKCEEYSSTTLTSLQGFVNYMHEKKFNYSCDFGFDENYNFKIIINFNKNEK
jgi:hypothetical protein